MKVQYFFLIAIAFGLYNCSNDQIKASSVKQARDSIIKIEMNLSAFGVESDNVPSINAFIDFNSDSSSCTKSYYNPANKGSRYSLTKDEMQSVLHLLKIPDLEKLKKKYEVNLSDQPKSTTKVYTIQKTFIIEDYGMKGEYPLQELYKIVYKY